MEINLTKQEYEILIGSLTEARFDACDGGPHAKELYEGYYCKRDYEISKLMAKISDSYHAHKG